MAIHTREPRVPCKGISGTPKLHNDATKAQLAEV
jgi:hypothetical protein